MTEHQIINNKDVWITVKPWHVQRDNSNIIPAEYFTAMYFLQQPADNINGEIIKDENDETKLFESPVAALTFTRKKLEAALK